MADLPLEDIKEFIHDEAAKGSELFEVFGMKFPAGQITLWGIALVLSIEVYLFLYLRQLAEKLRPDDPGWDAPWIGMDSSGLGKSLFFITLVPLPVASLALLTVRRTTQLLSVVPSNRFLHWRAEIGALIFACGMSLALALLCWKYRPRLIVETSDSSPSTDNVSTK